MIGSLTSLKGVSRGEEEVAVRAIVSSAAIGILSLIRWYFKREAALGGRRGFCSYRIPCFRSQWNKVKGAWGRGDWLLFHDGKNSE